MIEDYRSARMETVEGKGLAKRAWEKYATTVSKALSPPLQPVTKRFGAHMTEELLGFWLIWHLEGGFEGLQRLGMSRTTIFRRIKRFRQITGWHPDEFELGGVSIDLAKYASTPYVRGPGGV